jgi:hypothetical protein
VPWGDATNFHEWAFRTRLHVATKTGDNYVEAVSKVVEGLRGDTSVVAHEVGLSDSRQEPTDHVPSGTQTHPPDEKMVSPLITREA